MPRRPRHIITGRVHHIINRGNERRRLFFEDADYATFLRLMTLGKQRYDVAVLAVCVMPNHFHALIQPKQDGSLSGYLQWVLGSYASDLRSRTGTVGHGHVFQRRFWSDGIKDVLHFLTVLRYIEANPVRASLVPTADAWPWSSMSLRARPDDTLLAVLPVPLPDRWMEIVNEPQPVTEIEVVRYPLSRGRPSDADRAHRLMLQYSG
jgi:putative transposase